MKPDDYVDVKSFDTLTAINPEEWLRLERGPRPITNRVIDLLAPMGKGQRALIVAPPRSGKTIMLQDMAGGILENHPDVKVIVLLIDERPEEVTDMRRNVIGGEVIASSLDMDVESHVRLSQLAIDRARRLAEMGQDVFLVLDSITRLARAFNKWVGRSGRGGATMTGGLDIKAMDIPKKAVRHRPSIPRRRIADRRWNGTGRYEQSHGRSDFPGVQRHREHGVGARSKAWPIARVWPSIDISQSGTRREELLHDEETYEAVTMLRRTLSSMHPCDAMEQLTKQFGRFETNDEFIKLISGAKASALALHNV